MGDTLEADTFIGSHFGKTFPNDFGLENDAQGTSLYVPTHTTSADDIGIRNEPSSDDDASSAKPFFTPPAKVTTSG